MLENAGENARIEPETPGLESGVPANEPALLLKTWEGKQLETAAEEAKSGRWRQGVREVGDDGQKADREGDGGRGVGKEDEERDSRVCGTGSKDGGGDSDRDMLNQGRVGDISFHIVSDQFYLTSPLHCSSCWLGRWGDTGGDGAVSDVVGDWADGGECDGAGVPTGSGAI
jgi:hypothetical protein